MTEAQRIAQALRDYAGPMTREEAAALLLKQEQEIERLKESATIWHKRYEACCQERKDEAAKYGATIEAQEAALKLALEALERMLAARPGFVSMEMAVKDAEEAITAIKETLK